MALILTSCEFGPAIGTMAGILADVAQRHRLTVEDLKGPSSKHYIAHPRQEAMWLMYQVPWPNGRVRYGRRNRYSYPQIGAFLGGRDHSTVWYGCRRHEARQRAWERVAAE